MGGYCLRRPRNCLLLDIRKVFKRNMPLSLTSGIRHCWRRDVRQGQCLVLIFFLSFSSPFCLQHTTNYPSGTAMTQLQMFLYSPHRNHGDSGSCQHMKSALILELQQGHSSNQACVWLTLGIAVTDFCRTWFKTMYLLKNFSEKGKKKELLLC